MSKDPIHVAISGATGTEREYVSVVIKDALEGRGFENVALVSEIGIPLVADTEPSLLDAVRQHNPELFKTPITISGPVMWRYDVCEPVEDFIFQKAQLDVARFERLLPLSGTELKDNLGSYATAVMQVVIERFDQPMPGMTPRRHEKFLTYLNERSKLDDRDHISTTIPVS